MFNKKRVWLGAAYYPEAWDRKQIDEDLDIMQSLGINAVRVAEFAWSTMEPSEGKFDFSLFREVVDKCRNRNMAVIMCTPSACTPNWLSEKYPEVMQVSTNGMRAIHTGRRYVCSTNKKYRELCEKIITKMALEFKDDDNIIGWQIDNELYIHDTTGKGCCCPDCLEAFKELMKQKYGTIEKLNSSWGNFIFSLNYDSFDQLHTPINEFWPHPSYHYEWFEFQNNAHIDFAHFQADILKKYVSVPIGTDMMPYLGIDHVQMNSKLDVVQYNHYNDENNQWECAFWYDYMRCVKNKPFWITETSTCWNGSTESLAYRPTGFCYVNSWLPIIMGAEANFYWLWRSHWSGQEMQHGAVVDTCGRPFHTAGEIKRLADEYSKAEDVILDTYPINNEIAVHQSHMSMIMNMRQEIIRGFKYPEAVRNNIYRPLMERQLRPDVIHPSSELDGYKIVITPYVFCIEEGELNKRIYNWVKNGGIWIVGPLSDIRTPSAAKYKNAPLGHVEDFADVRVEFTLPYGKAFKTEYNDGAPIDVQSVVFNALSTGKSAESIAKYTECELAGYSAITETKIGKGKIIVMGFMPEPDEFGKLVQRIAEEAGIAPLTEADKNAVTVLRDGKCGRVFCAAEVENKEACVVVPFDGYGAIDGKKYTKGERVKLPPFGVIVVKMSE